MLKKRILIAVCAVIVLAGFTLAAFTGVSAKPKLSEMSDEELVQYVIDAGVKTVIEYDLGAETIRLMVKELEDDPDHPPLIAINWKAIPDLFEELREVVKMYYGIEP